MQTILGAGGVIANELAKELPKYTENIRLVSRNPKKVNDNDELFAADITNYDEVIEATNGSDVVYLTAGFEYNYKVWVRTWPVVMNNVISACEANNSKLVFFDNIYLYDGDNLNPITENHPINPSSKKGAVRAEIVKMLWDAVEKDGLKALIARAADFYGPDTDGIGMLTEAIIKPLHDGKKASWFGGIDYKHSFTYTKDAGKATALLGNTEEAYGETWHLPTASDPWTLRKWINVIAEEFDQKPKHQVANKFITKVMGLFNPVMHEIDEMYYQYDRDYVFNSDKFEKHFDFKPTPYEVGLKENLQEYK